MRLRNTPTTADELLALLAGATEQVVAPAELAQALAGRGSRRERRAQVLLEVLETEGLIARHAAPDGTSVYAATFAGEQALVAQGQLPEGPSTVLFTDLVNSTALIAEHGEDEAHALRTRHFAALRAALLAHRGREVKSLGDGLMVVFRDPADALRAAAEMQRRVARDRDRLGLRVGIHTGEVFIEDGDLHGSTVVIASRLCASAQAGEIVISEAVRECVAGPPAAAPLGELQLKGIGEPVTAALLRWDERAALRTTSSALGAA